mmetsp:Transcript_30754/g.64212  ORF Transcript_30754/g.64212 Transcript_30754/m.64212 type:complete len:331 (-) Transcript_30754:992-1984(-)
MMKRSSLRSSKGGKSALKKMGSRMSASSFPALERLYGSSADFSVASDDSSSDDVPVTSEVLDREIGELPCVTTWPHRPVMLRTSGTTRSSTVASSSDPLPLGEPIEFDSGLFVGKALIRIRNIESTASSDQEYFADRKRTKLLVFQGRVKEPLPCSDVWFGDTYEKPLNMSSVAHWVVPIIQKLVPGVNMDVLSKNPKVMVPLAGDCKTLNVSRPGEEPDITAKEFVEKTSLLTELTEEEPFLSVEQRKKVLRDPKQNGRYMLHPDYVYTFELYDDVIDFADYSIKIPVVGQFPLKHPLNSQPFTLIAETKDKRELFKFRIFHEEQFSES